MNSRHVQGLDRSTPVFEPPVYKDSLDVCREIEFKTLKTEIHPFFTLVRKRDDLPVKEAYLTVDLLKTDIVDFEIRLSVTLLTKDLRIAPVLSVALCRLLDSPSENVFWQDLH